MIESITDIMQGRFVNLMGDIDVMLHPTAGLVVRQGGPDLTGLGAHMVVFNAAQLAHLTRLCEGLVSLMEVVTGDQLPPPHEGDKVTP